MRKRRISSKEEKIGALLSAEERIARKQKKIAREQVRCISPPEEGKIEALLSAAERIAHEVRKRIFPKKGKIGALLSAEEKIARKQKRRIFPKKGKVGAVRSAEERIARKQKRSSLSGNGVVPVMALVFIPIGLFVLFVGFNATSEARRIASYPVLAGPGFEAMAPGEHAVIFGVLEGNAPIWQHPQLVAYSHEQWHINHDPGDERTGYWKDLGTHVPGLAVSLDGAIVQTAWRDSGVDMEGRRHEVIYQQGSGRLVHEGIREGSRRVIGFKNGDPVTVVGEKDANGTLIPEILYGGELAQLLSRRRGFALSMTLAGGLLIALVPLAWLAMRLHRRIRAGFGKRGGAG